MLEPRGAVHSTIFRREASTITNNIDDPVLHEPLIQFEDHEEPEFPIHPALEYETRAPKEQQQQQQPSREKIARFLLAQQLPEPNRRKRQRLIANLKLSISFLFLVLSGVGTVTFTKLQTIPMYVCIGAEPVHLFVL
jgi:hypothetical protein